MDDLRVARADMQSRKIRLYFDTSIVRSAILGAQEYVGHSENSAPKVDTAAFSSPRALAACLLAAGYLGEFSLLPPHQAEFLNHLKFNDAFIRRPEIIEKSLFFQEIGIESPWKASIKSDSPEEDIRHYLNKYAGRKIEKLFKAIQCVRMQWWERLKQLRQDKIFMPVREHFDLVSIQSSSELFSLLEVIERNRNAENPERKLTINHLNDALSILMLVQSVDRYNKSSRGDSRNDSVPRFYDPEGWFGNIAKEANLSDRLTINSPYGESSVFVSTDYLVYSASLRSDPDAYMVQDDLTELLISLADLESSTDYQDRSKQHEMLLRAVHARLEEVMTLTFLKNIWLKTLAVKDVRKIAVSIENEAVMTKDFRANVSRTIDLASSDVLNSAQRFRHFSKTWTSLKRTIDDWLTTENNDFEKDPVARAEMMLLRIGPSARIETDLRNLLSILAADQFTSDCEGIYIDARNRLFEKALIFSKSKTAKKSTSDEIEAAELVVGMLWAMNSYSWIYDRFTRLSKSYQSFFISAACAAAGLELKNENQWSESQILHLNRKLNSLRKSKELPLDKHELLVRHSAVAYLWFRIWTKKRDSDAWWRLEDGIETTSADRSADTHLESAIKRIDQAWSYCEFKFDKTDTLPIERLIYVANLRLYFLVEQGALERIADMTTTHARLEQLRARWLNLWRPTYEDTLARFYAFKAITSDSSINWDRWLTHAETSFNFARKASGDEAVRRFGIYLLRARERGYRESAFHPRIASRSVKDQSA